MFDNWSVNVGLSGRVFNCSSVFSNYRSIVQPLVNRIPGNCHISFESYEVALEVYEAAKRRDDLRVIWITIEDELTYGPEKKDAMM